MKSNKEASNDHCIFVRSIGHTLSVLELIQIRRCILCHCSRGQRRSCCTVIVDVCSSRLTAEDLLIPVEEGGGIESLREGDGLTLLVN